MDIGIYVFVVFLGLGLIWWATKLKPKTQREDENTEFQKLNLKVANLTAEGKVQDRDFVVAIISESELNVKTPEQIREWVKVKIGKDGTLSSYTINGLGLYELTYTADKVYDVLFLVVEETLQPVIPVENIYHITLKSDIDNTYSIREQIDAIPDGTPGNPNIIQLPKGRFWTEGDSVYLHHAGKGIIPIYHRKHLVIRGDETILYTKAPAIPYGGNVGFNRYSYRRHIWVRYSEDITVENIRIEGSNTIDGRIIGTTPELTPDFWYLTDYATAGNDGRDWKYLLDENGNKRVAPRDTGSIEGAPAYLSYLEQEHALDIRNSKNITVRNFDVFGVWGDGIYAGANDGGVSENISIANCHFKFVGRQGIAAANNVDGLIIDSVWVDLGRRASIDFEPHTKEGYVRNAIVKNSKLHGVQVPIAALGFGDVSNIQILNNEFSGGNFIVAGDSHPVNPQRRSNWIIRGNIRTNWFGSPLASSAFHLTDNILFKDNVDQVSSQQSRQSMSFRDCGGEIIVRNNDFKGGNKIYSFNGKTVIILEGNTPEQTII